MLTNPALASPGMASPGADAATSELRRIVADHYQAVYRYAFRLSGNAAEAEDLTQQTFLLVQARLHQLRDREKARSWTFAVLRNCFLKSRRRQRPVTAANLELDVDLVPDQRIAEWAADRLDVQHALNALPDEFRVVVLMFYFEELSYLEIAERLSMPIGTVMSRLSRAKARLRQQLFADEPQPPTRSSRSVPLASP